MDLDHIQQKVKEEAEKLSTISELTDLWRKYLGKNGVLQEAFSEIKSIPNEKRKDYGKKINTLRSEIDATISNAKLVIEENKNKKYLSEPQGKLTYKRPKVGHLHPLTETINEMNAVFRSLGYSVMDGPEIETDLYNFQRLNVPLDHPARDLQDSIYIDEPNVLLRTQTSSIEARSLETLKPPYRLVMPGRSYRNEKVNKSNHFVFHQYQLTVVQEKVSLAELLSTIDFLFKSMFGPEVKTRFRNKYYPEVEPGVGPDMLCFNCHGTGCGLCKGRGWMEMGGAGIIHPNVLKAAGIDSEKWQGYAFGLGLDRWAMARHNITDIRTLLGENLAYKPTVGNLK